MYGSIKQPQQPQISPGELGDVSGGKFEVSVW